jgi:hypothetical protein
MKLHLPLVISCLVLSSGVASAASLMLDFGNPAASSAAGTNQSPGPVAAGAYLTLSPGHALNSVPAGETSWNTITTSAARTDLVFSDSSAAAGITLTMGQEAVGGDGFLNYATAISTLNLVGSGGGTSGRQSLLGAGSIYGESRLDSTAVGRDGFFGGTGAAIGFRVDGLAAGDYVVYLMGRNTNSNAATLGGMTFHVTSGTTAGTFELGNSEFSAFQANSTYTTAAYAGEYGSFLAGESYVALSVSLAAGESLFVAVDGTQSELRGFLNMAQIVAVPEPAAALLGSIGLLALLRRRRA